MLKIFYCLLLCCATFGPSDGSHSTLEMVHVFFRHGSRTPELKDIYPSDPYTHDDFLPWGYGQLTNEGKMSAFKLGQLLKEKYSYFLGDIYTPEIIEATSTDFDRTKMSLLLVLAGLFPPGEGQKWHKDIPWMPIPYQYDKDAKDYFLKRPLYCPRYVGELQQVMASAVVQQELKSHRKLFQYIGKNSKKPIDKLMDVFGIYQTLTAEASMNLTLPEWATSVYPESIHSVAAKRTYYENYNDVMKKLNGGRSLQKVIRNMLEKTSRNGTEKRIFLYSGHENNILNILAALDLFDPIHIPPYCATVILELHYVKETAQYAVKILYSRDIEEGPQVQKLPECDQLCPLDDFVRITKHRVPVNYTEECESPVYLD